MEELQRLPGGHRRDRRRLVVAPRIVLMAFRHRRHQRRLLEPRIAHLQRQPELAREGRILLPAPVESRRRSPRRRRRKPDIGGRRKRREKGLLGRLGELVWMRRAKLQLARASPNHHRFATFGAKRISSAHPEPVEGPALRP
jgi:hypothetical protein